MAANVRRYILEFGGAMVLYSASVLLSQIVVRSVVGAEARIAVAAAPLVPATLAVWAFLRYYATVDELQQRMIGEAAAFSFLTSGLVTLAYGFLETAGFPRIGLVFVLPLMIALWGIGMGIASRRYA